MTVQFELPIVDWKITLVVLLAVQDTLPHLMTLASPKSNTLMTGKPSALKALSIAPYPLPIVAVHEEALDD